MLRQTGRILWMKQQAVDAVVDQIGNTAHVGGDCGAGHSGAFRQRVREGFGQGGQKIDVQRVIKTVDLFHPTGKTDASRRAELVGQSPHLRFLRAVACDDKANVRMRLQRSRKRANQRGHILQGRDARCNAKNHAVRLQLHAKLPQICLAGREVLPEREINAVVQRKDALRVKAAGDHKLGHAVGNADPGVQPPERELVDRAVGECREGPAHIVQPVIAVDGGNDGNGGAAAQQHPHHIGARAVTVDDLITVVTDHGENPSANGEERTVAQNGGGDPQTPCFLCKFALRKADQVNIFRFIESVQQRQHVRLCTADIAAGDHMDDSHSFTFQSN